MGLFDDLFGSSGVAYPSSRAGAQNAPGTTATATRNGFFEKLFAPQELAYPAPAVPGLGNIDPKQLDDRLKALVAMLTNQGMTCTPVSATPAPSPAPSPPPAASVSTTPTAAPAPATPAPTAAPAASSVPAASSPSVATNVPTPAPSPVTVVFALDAASLAKQTDAAASTASASTPSTSNSAASASSPSTSSTAGGTSATAAPASTAGSASSATSTAASQALVINPDPSKVLRAYVFNPEFTPCYPTAQETYLEEVLEEEVIRSRLITRDATPVAFVVPDGCDSVDLLYSPIEVNPGVGTDDDLNQVVLASDAKLSANIDGLDGPLTPGDQVIVTVPWRAASWVDMPAGTLRMQVMAHFYKAPVMVPLGAQ